MTLATLDPGRTARIVAVSGAADIQQRLLELGLLPGVEVRMMRCAPLGDPLEVDVLGYRLAIRKSEAALVQVEVQT